MNGWECQEEKQSVMGNIMRGFSYKFFSWATDLEFSKSGAFYNLSNWAFSPIWAITDVGLRRIRRACFNYHHLVFLLLILKNVS